MKKHKFIFITLLLSLITLNVLAEIQPPPPTIEFPQVDIWVLLNKALSWFFAFVVLAAVLMIILAGYGYISAGGDPAKTKSALNKVIYSAIGIGIALLAKVILTTVCNFIQQGACSFISF